MRPDIGTRRRPRRRPPRCPHVDVDLRGLVATHGVHTPQRVVLHSTECGDLPGTVELSGVARFWQRQHRGYGAEILIDKDGLFALAANPNQTTWAVENHNTGTVSIELIGYARFTPADWWHRRKQLDKLARTLAWLHVDCGIPLRLDVNAGVSRHLDQTRVFGGTHVDPGTRFPLGYVLRLARQYATRGWT